MAIIPIMRPKLPSADKCKPYLKQIDEARIYSNYGPLAAALEDRLVDHYRLNLGSVSMVANATMGLAIALALQEPQPGTLCVMPAWTFIASAQAATMVGLISYFIDVDPETWALDPNVIPSVITKAPAPVGAIMAVMPFGYPIDIARWDALQAKTKLAVVIDAAAGFDSLVPGAIPAVVSLHATKVLGIGEGGFVISTDEAVRRAVRMRANFGFDGTREAQVPAFNAKFSEYQAAVGHAALDEWATTRIEWWEAANRYRLALANCPQVSLQNGFGENWVSSTCVLRFSEPITDRIEDYLTHSNVELRRWWGMGAHRHPATLSFPRASLSASCALARSTIAVPLHRDIKASEVSRVAEFVIDAVRKVIGIESKIPTD